MDNYREGKGILENVLDRHLVSWEEEYGIDAGSGTLATRFQDALQNRCKFQLRNPGTGRVEGGDNIKKDRGAGVSETHHHPCFFILGQDTETVLSSSVTLLIFLRPLSLQE